MNNLSNTAKKLDKVFEIARIVLGALAIASAVFIVLIGLGYVLGWDPEFLGTGFTSFEIGFLELEIAEKTGASTATISRVNRSLNYGSDGYELIFERLANSSDLKNE